MDNKSQNSDRKYYLFALKIMGDFGVAIAVPVVIMVLLGQWLDGKYSSAPLFTVFGFIIAALVTVKTIYKKAKIYGKEYQKLGENLNQDKK